MGLWTRSVVWGQEGMKKHREKWPSLISYYSAASWAQQVTSLRFRVTDVQRRYTVPVGQLGSSKPGAAEALQPPSPIRGAACRRTKLIPCDTQSAVSVALQPRRKGNSPAKTVSHFCHAGLSVGGFSGQAVLAPSVWADLSLCLLIWWGNLSDSPLTGSFGVSAG